MLFALDPSGARVVKEVVGTGGNGEITLYLRDGSGHVLSEYRPVPAGATTLRKDYIYAGAQLVAENARERFLTQAAYERHIADSQPPSNSSRDPVAPTPVRFVALAMVAITGWIAALL